MACYNLKGYCRYLAALFALAVALTIVAIRLDVFHQVVAWAMRYEKWELAELIFIFPFAVIFCGGLFLMLLLRHLAKLSQEQETILDRLFRNAEEAIVLTDVQGNIIQINNAFEEQTGYASQEVLGKTLNIIRSKRHDDSFFSEMWNILEKQDKWSGEVWNRRKDGETYPQLVSIMAIKNQQGRTTQYLGILKDISLMKREMETVRRMAYEDPLTGLPNRMLFEDRLQQACGQGERRQHAFAVFFIDLNGFKGVNDVHGHYVGDQVLIESGRRIAANLRENDTVARFGGDEFTALVRDVDSWEQALDLAFRVNKAFEPSMALEEVDLLTGVSIGVAMYPQCSTSPLELVEMSDVAMYAAKVKGGGVMAASCGQEEEG